MDKLNEREHLARSGIKIEKRKRREQHTVREIAETITLPRLQAERARILNAGPAKKAHVIAVKVSRVRAVILPAIGDRGIANLDEEDLERLVKAHKVHMDQRGAQKKESEPTEEPKRSTIANINSAWLEVVQDAIDQGYIAARVRKRLTISQSGLQKGERGSSFSPEEMLKLREFMSDAWIAQGHTEVVRQDRYLTRALVSLMTSTGLTPGLEVETLSAAQVREAWDTNRELSLRITVRKHQGKRKHDRVVWARVRDAWEPVEDMRALRVWICERATDEYRRRNPNGYLFARPLDGRFPLYAVIFADILDKLGMRVDPVTKVNRRLYSCRHYYATQSLYDGVDLPSLSINMSTSLRMIDEHYGHVLADMQANRLQQATTGASCTRSTAGADITSKRPRYHPPLGAGAASASRNASSPWRSGRTWITQGDDTAR